MFSDVNTTDNFLTLKFKYYLYSHLRYLKLVFDVITSIIIIVLCNPRRMSIM